MWRQKRQEKNQEMSTAIERARQRRDEEEKRMESERRRGAEEKLKALDERAKRKNDTSKVNYLIFLRILVVKVFLMIIFYDHFKKHL